ncbi:MAG: hypothetical protein CM15mP125_4170 [Gammaproteobacteria bacterium]|nr:MAG: hypothetical protein CM15mP125_4170 [Gammaproteobacteria bacterium]
MTDALLQELRGETLWLTLNRPNELNAMNKPLVSALSDTFEALRGRHDVRIVVFKQKEELFVQG